MALYSKVVNLGPVDSSVYLEKRTQVTFSNENFVAHKTFSTRKEPRCWQESQIVTGEDSVP